MNISGSKEAQVTLHTVSFIRYVLPHASEAELRTGLESLLRVVALKHTKVASAALQALTTLFKQECQMTGEMQGQILMVVIFTIFAFFNVRPLSEHFSKL